MKKWLIPLAMAAGLVAVNANAQTWYNRFRDGRDIPFTQNGANAITSNVDAKLKTVVSVFDFGDPSSTCTGSSNDSTIFQRAMNSLSSKGGTLLVPNGAVCTVTGLTWANSTSLVIQGAGIGSKLVIGATSGNMLSVTNGSVDIENLTAQYATPGTVTSGYFFSFVGARGVLRNVTFYNGFNLAYWGDAASGGADNVSATGMSNDGFKVDVSPSTVGQQYGIMKFSGLKFQGTSINNGSGLNLVSGDTLMVSDSNLAGFKINVNATTSASRSYLANLFFTNVLADGAGGPTSTFFGWHFDGTNQFLGRVYISNSWANYMPGGWGIYVKNASTISIKDTQISANDMDGIYLDTGATDVQISGNTISGNSAASSGTYHGVRAVAGANNIYIRGNLIGPTQTTNTAGVKPDTQKYAISIGDVSITNYEITNNRLTGNTAGQIQDLGGGTVGTTKIVSRNITGSAQTETFTAAPIFTTLTGLLKGNGSSAITAAVSGTDYAPATSGTAILYGNGSGGFSSVTVGGSLSFSGGTLGLNLANANTFTALQGVSITGGNATYTLNDVSGGNIAGSYYQSAGTTAWWSGKATNGHYYIYDNANAKAVIDATAGGDLKLDPLSGNTSLYQLTASGPVKASQFQIGATVGFSGTKTAGSCTLTINGGIITNVTGC